MFTSIKSRLHSAFSGLLPFFVMSHAFSHLVTALPVPLLPLIRDEFALDYTRAGLVISACSLASGFGQLPSGWLADRVGRRTMITVAICGVGIAGILVGISHTYVMLIVFLVAMGLVSGGYHPSAPPLITALVEPHRRGRALGIHLLGGSIAHFLSPLLGAAIAIGWGWRGSFIGLAVPTAIFGIIFYFIISRQPAMLKIEKSAGAQEEMRQPENNRKQLVILMILSGGVGSLVMSSISFFALFMVDRFGLGKETAAAAIALLFFAGLWSTTVGGYLSDRFGRIPVVLAVCLSLGPLIFLMNVAPWGLGMGALLIVLGSMMYMRMPASEAYIVSHTSRRHRSTILGIYYFSSMESSALFTPLLGLLIDRAGFFTGFSVVAIVMVVITLVCAPFLWGGRD